MIEFIPFVGDFHPSIHIIYSSMDFKRMEESAKGTKEERELHHILSEVDNDNNYYYYCKHNDKNIMK